MANFCFFMYAPQMLLLHKHIQALYMRPVRYNTYAKQPAAGISKDMCAKHTAEWDSLYACSPHKHQLATRQWRASSCLFSNIINWLPICTSVSPIQMVGHRQHATTSGSLVCGNRCLVCSSQPALPNQLLIMRNSSTKCKQNCCMAAIQFCSSHQPASRVT